MAKFKKRRSKPVDAGPEPEQRPDTAPEPLEPKPEQRPAEKPPEPPVNTAQQGEKDSKLNKLFWMRVVFAVIAGTAATFLFDSYEGEERRWASIGFMIAVFAATIVIAKSMRIPFSLADRKKLVTQGIGSYVFLYLFVWIMSYTLANLNGASQVPFP